MGLNYRDHVAETNGSLPAAPIYFAKYRRALTGPYDPIRLPPPEVSTSADWEVDLAVVIGRGVRNTGAAEAAGAIAGFTVLNGVSIRFADAGARWPAGRVWRPRRWPCWQRLPLSLRAAEATTVRAEATSATDPPGRWVTGRWVWL